MNDEIFLAAILPLSCSVALAQPAFEVAWIKPGTDSGGDTLRVYPGSLTMTNISLRRCIQWAWEAPRAQLSGLGSTLDPTAYTMTTESGAPTERVDPMSMILTALPIQLGLKVESGKDSVKFWVVDAANKVLSGN